MRGEIPEVLRRARIRPCRRAGQHHLVDQNVLRRIVGHASLRGDEVVLEVGAGAGNLTRMLAGLAGKVIAVERDRRFRGILEEIAGEHENVNLIFGDVMRIKLPKFDKVVSNIPYSISSDLTFKLLDCKFELGVVLYQEEFARRMVAGPGSEEYGRLTVNVYRRAEVKLLDEVPPNAFYPPPNVSSRVVLIKPREPPFEVPDERIFSALVRAMFQHRNQAARNALYRSFEEVFPGSKLPKLERRKMVDGILGEMGQTKVFELSPEQFAQISRRITSP
ncbi:MAG: 16S rRNA (adenine(1518)-N(6)/adenine(1519)-N(6))-dimethyltransferase RsmA [Candidatus Hadarchaeales archaeon]